MWRPLMGKSRKKKTKRRKILRERSSIFKQTPPACVHTDYVRTVVVFLSSAILKYTRVNQNGGCILLALVVAMNNITRGNGCHFVKWPP